MWLFGRNEVFMVKKKVVVMTVNKLYVEVGIDGRFMWHGGVSGQVGLCWYGE